MSSKWTLNHSRSKIWILWIVFHLQVTWYPVLVCQVRSILKCKREHVIIKAKRGILSLQSNLCILNEQCMAQLETFDRHGWCHHMCVSLGKRKDYFYKEGGLSKVMSVPAGLFPNLQGWGEIEDGCCHDNLASLFARSLRAAPTWV